MVLVCHHLIRTPQGLVNALRDAQLDDNYTGQPEVSLTIHLQGNMLTRLPFSCTSKRLSGHLSRAPSLPSHASNNLAHISTSSLSEASQLA